MDLKGALYNTKCTTTAVVQDIPWVLVNFMSGRDKICFSSASQFKKKMKKQTQIQMEEKPNTKWKPYV